MKNILLITLMFFCSCNTGQKEKDSAATEKESEAQNHVQNLCYLNIGNEIQRENTILRDSTVLNFQIEGKNVSGIYEWVPAEKDSRKGIFEGIKSGKNIIGKYHFSQEGIQEMQTIRIEIKENSVIIITNVGKIEEMKMEAEKVDCAD